MRKAILGAVFALSVAAPATAASFDGAVVITNSPACPILTRGMQFAAVYQQRAAGIQSSFNIYGHRVALHFRNNSTTATFNENGQYTGAMLRADGSAIQTSGNYRITMTPAPTPTPQNFTATGWIATADCGTISFKGAFTRQLPVQ